MIHPEMSKDKLTDLLLVDDDELFCQVLAQALYKRGFKVHVAHNTEDGLQLAKELVPEYAIIDLNMPGGSGLELIKPLIALNNDSHILLLTGYASIATAVEAIKLGATHYLAKPADADEILAALHKGEGDTDTPITEKPLSVNRLEWEHIQKVLMEHEGNISAAARALNMHRRTLQRKLAKHPAKE